MLRLRSSIAIGLAITAVVVLSASQDPPPTGAGPQGGATGRRGGPTPGGAPIGGTLTPKKPDDRRWGWQVKALMNPATPRPLYNRAKEALFNDRQITSYTISSFDPDLYCEVGKHFDFIWFEMQHSTMSWDEVRRMIVACPRVGAAPFVRMPDAFESSIQKATDIGALGIIVPTVDTAEKAEAAVKWSKYPPLGRRSQGAGQYRELWGNDYRQTANDNMLVVIMIETPEGVANAEKIAAVPGIDVIFAASTDLGNFSGHKQGEPQYEALVTRIKDATLARGLKLGGPLAWKDRPGFSFFQAPGETVLINAGAQAILKSAPAPATR